VKRVKVNVAHMWKPSPVINNLFAGMPYVHNRFEFVPSRHPDYVFYGSYKANGPKFPPGNYKRIFYTGERDRPNMNECDWAFTHWYDEDIKHPRHMRLPVYTFFGAGRNLQRELDKQAAYEVLRAKTKFCAFVYSNSVPLRNRFFKQLSKYKRVDSPGRVLNNMPPIGQYRNAMSSRMASSWDQEKVRFLSAYKFVIAFENTSQAGYTTEKIYHPMAAKSLPIYWGNPEVQRDFNPKSFIWVKSPKHFDDAIDRIIQLDKDPDLYVKTLMQPWYPDGKLTPYVNPQDFIDRFTEIFGA
jgi:hypothetical protein